MLVELGRSLIFIYIIFILFYFWGINCMITNIFYANDWMICTHDRIIYGEVRNLDDELCFDWRNTPSSFAYRIIVASCQPALRFYRTELL